MKDVLFRTIIRRWLCFCLPPKVVSQRINSRVDIAEQKIAFLKNPLQVDTEYLFKLSHGSTPFEIDFILDQRKKYCFDFNWMASFCKKNKESNSHVRLIEIYIENGYCALSRNDCNCVSSSG